MHNVVVTKIYKKLSLLTDSKVSGNFKNIDI